MASKGAALSQYRKKISKELSKRYAGLPPYTERQVSTAVEDLRLNERYIRYAFLMFCEEEVLVCEGIEEQEIASKRAEVEQSIGNGISGDLICIIANVGDANGGDGGDGDGC